MSSVKRSLDVLECVVAADRPPSHAELARQLSIPKSTLTQLLSGLRDHGYLTMLDGHYHPGIRLISLGFSVAYRDRVLASAKPALDELARETGETVLLGVRSREQIIYIDQSPSPNPIRYVAQVGAVRPLHATAMGRVFMAFGGIAPQDLAHRPKLTPKTRTDVKTLTRIVEGVRRDGYGVNEGESVSEVFAIAAPVLDRNGEIVAGITVVGPGHRMGDMRERIWPALARTIETVRRQSGLT